MPPQPEYETGFILDPEPPTEPPAPPSPTPAVVTTKPPEHSLPIMSHGIPEEYSQNPEHISHISGHTLWYKDLHKLKGSDSQMS